MSAGRTRSLGPTYRLQLTPAFGFAAAAQIAPYLASLGVEFAYLSPIFEARPGSEHGYDVTDPTRVREELGGLRGFEELAGALHAAGVGVLADIVPNHLSTYTGGRWWRDVLRLGRGSQYAAVYDIDWRPAGVRLEDEDKVILPILGAPMEEVLERHELSVVEGTDGPVLSYFGTDLPLAPDGPIDPGAPISEILRAQHYRLVWWREPVRNYRRFFTIDDLVGVRVEDPAVFTLTHSLVADLLATGLVDALRVDHVDGLADPARYLDDLAALAGTRPLVVEKILTGEEPLRASWPVAGTTGYEVADEITNALADADGIERLAGAAAADGERRADEVIDEGKRLVVTTSFPSEVGRVADLLRLTTDEVVDATVRMPVYRTYVSSRGAGELDEWLLEVAGGPGLRKLATGPLEPDTLEGVVRFQQLTSAAMAKGVEDTAWYRLVGKLPFLEVGGDPEQSPRADEDGIARLHRRTRARVAAGQHGLVAGTTHDTKRSADVRARLLALAAMVPAFEGGLALFTERVPARQVGDARPPVPGPLERRRIAETCLAMAPLPGASPEEWDELAARIALRKGAREAKTRDSWEDVNEPYETALTRAARALMADSGRMLKECFGPVLSRVQRYGASLSLAQVVLRSTLPGVPDCYQGDEAWNFALTDPDNRRPVDFAGLAATVDALPAGVAPQSVGEIRKSWSDGRVKTLVTRQSLAARRAIPAAFGPRGLHLRLGLRDLPDHAPASAIAFARHSPGRAGAAVVVVTRSPHRLEAARDDLPVGERAWQGAALEVPGQLSAPNGGEWVDMLSGAHLELGPEGSLLSLGQVLASLPVAVLVPRS